MSFDIPKEDLNMVYEVAANHIANSRITPTPENIKQAVDVAAATYFYTNRAKIFTKVVNNALAEAGGKTIKTVTNSAKKGADVHVGKSQTVKEAADLIFDELGGNQY